MCSSDLIPGPLSKRKRRLDSLEAAQGAPRVPRRDSRGERSPWLPLETRLKEMPCFPCVVHLSFLMEGSTSIESVMPSSHLILCRPLLLLPPIPPSIRVFSNESTRLLCPWGFSRQEYWSAPPESSRPRDRNCFSLHLLYWQADSLPLAPPGKPKSFCRLSQRLI